MWRLFGKERVTGYYFVIAMGGPQGRGTAVGDEVPCVAIELISKVSENKVLERERCACHLDYGQLRFKTSTLVYLFVDGQLDRQQRV